MCIQDMQEWNRQHMHSEADYETTLTQVRECLTNHVDSSHNMEWHAASHHVSRMEPQTWSEKASAPPVPSPVPQPEPLGGGMLPPTPTERPPCRYMTMWCPYNSTTCKKSLTQVVGASIDVAADQLQARMACHGTDAHAMTWDLASDLVLFQ